MNSQFLTSALLTVFVAVVTVMGFAGKTLPSKSLKKFKPEQLSKFARFSAWGYLVLTIGCGIQTYFEYIQIESAITKNVPFFAALVVCFVIVIIGQKKYLKK